MRKQGCEEMARAGKAGVFADPPNKKTGWRSFPMDEACQRSFFGQAPRGADCQFQDSKPGMRSPAAV